MGLVANYISFTYLLFVASQLSQAYSPLVAEDYLSCLHSQNVYTPNNSSYPSVWYSSVQNLRRSRASFFKPFIIITPSHESEIQTAIRCAAKTNIIRVRVRSGGHDYEGLSYASTTPFVLIDLRNFSSISIDTEENTAWVKSGATIGELYHKIANSSKTLAFTAGVCPTVGIGGHFSGGGYSMMSRKYGLAVDNIIDARVMDVNGDVLDGRESMGEDLFWAIRGGGGTSFGIVLAWKIRLLSVPEKVTVFNVTRTQEQNVTNLLYKWQHVASRIDERLLIRVLIDTIYSDEDRNKTIYVSFTSLFLGEADELLAIMRNSFPELGLKEEDCKEMNWIDSIVFFGKYYLSDDPSIDDLLNRNVTKPRYKAKSDYVTRPISINGWKAICDRLLGEGEFSSHLTFNPYGGRMSQISESATPFPHRAGTLFLIHYFLEWENEAEGRSRINWIKSLYQFMAPYVSKSPRGAYFNYRDLDLGDAVNDDADMKNARVWGTKYFKNNFDRLVYVKTKVDPQNFINEQSIPPMTSSFSSFSKFFQYYVTLIAELPTVSVCKWPYKSLGPRSSVVE